LGKVLGGQGEGLRDRQGGRFARLGEVLGGIAAILVVLSLAVVVTWARQRAQVEATTIPSSGPVAAANATGPSASDTADPTIAATAEVATPAPVTEPPRTPAPTSTPKPAPKPKPTGDPRPEGTEILYRASGHLGQTVGNGDMSLRVDHAAMPSTFEMKLCGSADPEMQGYTEAFAYSVTLSWTGNLVVGGIDFEIGDHPFNLMWFDHQPTFANGQPEVVVVCHRPTESMTIHVAVGIDGANPLTEYRWTIT
jgi:hypothetical protein